MAALTLEGKVERLRREVTDAVGEVGAPEGEETLVLHDPLCAVDDALEWPVERPALDHLVLVLDDLQSTMT